MMNLNRKNRNDEFDELVKSRHSREGGNPGARNFLKRMDSRLRTSGMTAMKRTFCDVVRIADKIKKGRMKILPFYFFVKGLLKELSERVDEDENKDNDECVNCKRLDHRETDDEGCGDLA